MNTVKVFSLAIFGWPLKHVAEVRKLHGAFCPRGHAEMPNNSVYASQTILTDSSFLRGLLFRRTNQLMLGTSSGVRI